MAVRFSDEAVAFAGYSLDESWVVGVVFQGMADFSDGGVDAVFGVNEDILAPETVDDFLSGDDAALPLQKKDEQLRGDAFEGNAFAFLGASPAAQLEAGAIELEFSEAVLQLRHYAPKLRHKTIALQAVARVKHWASTS